MFLKAISCSTAWDHTQSDGVTLHHRRPILDGQHQDCKKIHEKSRFMVRVAGYWAAGRDLSPGDAVACVPASG